MTLPALRPLEIFPVRHNGDTRYCLRDVHGVTGHAVLLTPQQVVLAVCLDGRAEVPDVQEAFARAFGARLSETDVERFVQSLDEALLLETPRFQAHFERVREEFRLLPARPAMLAGASYPAAPEALSALLEGCFDAPGPGPLNGSPLGPLPQAGGEGSQPHPFTGGRRGESRLVGIVSPHIDFSRGGHSYAWAYQEVLKHGLADLYVILGVAHVSPPAPFVLCLKDFETPFGPAPCERTLGKALHAEVSRHDLLEHEFCHRSEHSIEFQVVWLAYCRRRLGGDFRILPLLCSAAPPPGEHGSEAAHETLAALARLLRGYPGKVCLLAGADLAHVGPRFGDEETVAALLPWMEAEDRKSLDRVLALDPEGFHRSVMDDGGKRRVCGLAALYATLCLLQELHPKAEGRLLRYAHAPDPAGGQVSFASLAFSDGNPL